MDEEKKLTGKNIVITGATSGIGFAAAKILVGMGANVLAVGRSEARCVKAKEQILAAHPGGQIDFLLADLSSMQSVRHLADEILARVRVFPSGQLDVLVNNAGTYCDSYTLTADGLEMTLAVNHFAPFLLTNLLLPALVDHEDGRVITVSSDSHYRTWLDLSRLNHPILYNGLWAYKCSKLANVLFTRELNRRFSARGLRALALDPGLVATEIGFKGTGRLARWIWQMRKDAGVPAEVPAEAIAHLASMEKNRNPQAEYWRFREPKPASAQAMRVDLARGLWQKSMELVHLPE
jgi:NAD(P)-dependent dehydrogenase (short-subunit alcohol dehydrogenase family)